MGLIKSSTKPDDPTTATKIQIGKKFHGRVRFIIIDEISMANVRMTYTIYNERTNKKD